MTRDSPLPVGNVPTGATTAAAAADESAASESAGGDAASPDRETVMRTLRTVSDPDLAASVVESGVVEDVAVADGRVRVAVTTDGLDPATTEDVTEAIRRALLSTPGVREATVEERAADAAPGPGDAHDASPPATSAGDHDHGHDHAPTSRPRGAAAHAPQTDDHSHDRGPTADPGTTDLDGVDRVVAVASAKGGVGKSTVAVGLARALAARGADVGVFDADIHGPNVHRLLDADGPVRTTDDGRAAPVAAAGVETMSVGLLAGDEPLGWRGAMAHEALTDLLGDTAWSDRDVLVVDLPPGTGDVVLTTLQSVPVDGVVLVTTPYPTAVADTGRTADLVRDAGVPVLGVVRNMTGFECPDCGGRHDPFGTKAGGTNEEGDATEGDGRRETDDPLDAPTLASLPLAPRVRDGVRPETDAPLPDALVDLAAAITERLDERLDLPAGALDLRGVPPAPAVEQAIAELRATAPGEPLYLRTDRDPDRLLSAVAETVTEAVDGPEGPPRLDTAAERRAPGEWAVRIRQPAPADADADSDVDADTDECRGDSQGADAAESGSPTATTDEQTGTGDRQTETTDEQTGTAAHDAPEDGRPVSDGGGQQ